MSNGLLHRRVVGHRRDRRGTNRPLEPLTLIGDGEITKRLREEGTLIAHPTDSGAQLVSLGRLLDSRDALLEGRDIARKIGYPTPYVLAAAYLGEGLPDLMPRVRRRQAIEAALVLGDIAQAQAIYEALDVPDRASLQNVPPYRAVTAAQ